MSIFLGLDIGTTNIKAAAFSLTGDLLAIARHPVEIKHPQPEWSEIDPESLWFGVCQCLRQIATQIDPRQIRAMAVSSMAESGFLMSRDNQILYPAICWYDSRSKAQSDQLEAALGRERLFALTGQVVSPKCGLTKLLWLRDNRPELFDQAAFWLSIEEFIINRLSGEWVTDYSVSARTLAFDIHKLDWSDEILNATGLPRSLFVPAVAGATPVGGLTSAAAAATCLKVGTMVAVGGHDHACAAVGVNIFREGVLLDSMGTSEVSMVAVDFPNVDQASMDNFFCCYPHCGPQLYRILTSFQACGAAFDWFVGALVKPERSKNDCEVNYDALFDLAAASGYRADLPLFMPYVRGSLENPAVRASFMAIEDYHNRGDFLNAIIEGISFEQRLLIERLEQQIGRPFSQLRTVGGMTRSAYWMALKATAMQRSVEIPLITESACYGAALLAAIASGDLYWNDLDKMCLVKRRYLPDIRPWLDDRYGTFFHERIVLMQKSHVNIKGGNFDAK